MEAFFLVISPSALVLQLRHCVMPSEHDFSCQPSAALVGEAGCLGRTEAMWVGLKRPPCVEQGDDLVYERYSCKASIWCGGEEAGTSGMTGTGMNNTRL